MTWGTSGARQEACTAKEAYYALLYPVILTKIVIVSSEAGADNNSTLIVGQSATIFSIVEIVPTITIFSTIVGRHVVMVNATTGGTAWHGCNTSYTYTDRRGKRTTVTAWHLLGVSTRSRYQSRR